MKPKFLAFPRHLVLTSSAVMAVLAPLSTFAADFTWKGATDSTWTDGTNWLLGTAPVYGTDYHHRPAASLPTVADCRCGLQSSKRGNDHLWIRPGHHHRFDDPGTGNLTVTSGTLKINGPGTSLATNPSWPMASTQPCLINGGAPRPLGARKRIPFVQYRVADLTSDLTITSGTFSSRHFDFFNRRVSGNQHRQPRRRCLAVTRFTQNRNGSTTSTLNLDGGTLRLRSTQTSPNVFLPDLTGLTTTVEDGGAIIDTNSFNGDHRRGAGARHHSRSHPRRRTRPRTAPERSTLSGANTFTGPVTVNAGTASDHTSAD